MTLSLQASSFHQVAADIGAAGEQVTHLGAAEASAGNISVFCAALDGVEGIFRPAATLSLPFPCPDLAGGWLVITGTGRRLRDVSTAPLENLCLLRFLEGGLQADLYQASSIAQANEMDFRGIKPVKPTSELDSHLAIHQDQAAKSAISMHAVVHAQPVALTYLSHLEDYASSLALSRRLVRWQPETILVLPEGLGLVPFIPPGTPAQAAATRLEMQRRRVVVWQKHGVVARAISAVKAADLVEYAEAAAAYEVLNLRLGEPATGLTDAELRQICATYGVEQEIA